MLHGIRFLVLAVCLLSVALARDGARAQTDPNAASNLNGLYEHSGSVVNISGGRGNFSGRLETVGSGLASLGYQTGDRIVSLAVPHQVTIAPSTDDAGLPGGVLTSGQHGEYLEKSAKCPEQWGSYEFRVESGGDPASVTSISGVVTYKGWETRYERAFHRLKRPVPKAGIVGHVDYVRALEDAVAAAGDHGDPKDCVPTDGSETATATFSRIDEDRAAQLARAAAGADEAQKGRQESAKGDTGSREPATDERPRRGEDPNTGRPTASRDPVLLHTGEFVLSQTDLVVRGRGLDWTFTRSYRSQRHIRTSLGWGWTHDAMPALVRNGRGWSFRGPDGGWVDLGADSATSDLFMSALGHRLRIGEDERLFRDVDGTLYRFAPLPGDHDRSRIVAIEDGAGNRLTYRTDLLGRVTEVVDTLGRSARYRYDDQTGTLVAVDAPDGQRVALIYDDAGNLVAVRVFATDTDTPARELRYAYNRSPDRPQLDHVMTKVWHPMDTDAPTVELTYGSDPAASDFGRVAMQRVGSVAERFSYRSLSGERDTAVLETSVESEARARDIYRFDARGLLLSRLENTADGRRRQWRYRYDDAGFLVETVQPLGDAVIVKRDSRGLATAIRSDPVPGSGEQPASYAVTYDPLFRNLKSMSGPFNGDVPADPTAVAAKQIIRIEYDYEGAKAPPWAVSLGLAPAGDGAAARAWLGRPVRVIAPGNPARSGEKPPELETTLAWDERGMLREMRSPSGASVRYDYQTGVDGLPAWISRVFSPRSNGIDRVLATQQSDIWGRAVLVTARGGPAVGIINDGLGRPITIVPQDPQAPRRRLDYDANGHIVREIDFGGNAPPQTIAEYVWDGAGHLTKETRFAGGGQAVWTTYERDPYGRVAAIADASGRTLRRYDGFGRLAEVAIEGTGDRFTYEFDDADNLIAETDAAGNAWRYRYDGFGRLQQATDPTGRTVVIRRDLAGEPIEFRLAAHAGEEATLAVGVERDLAGRPVAEWRASIDHGALGPTERRTLERDRLGRVVATTSAGGSRLTVRYDEDGTPIAFDGDGMSITLARDLAGTIGALARNGEPVLRLISDSSGRLSEILTPEYRARIDRHPGSETTTATLFAGFSDDDVAIARATQRSDWLGRLIDSRVEKRNGASWATADGVSYEWDAVSRLAAISHGGTPAGRFAYDAAGRLTRAQFFDELPVEYKYDPAHGTATATDGRGAQILRRYDGLGRMIERVSSLPGSSTPASTDRFAYDLSGSLVLHSHGLWSTNIRYDVAGRAVEEAIAVGGERNLLRREFNPAGELTKRLLPSGLEIGFATIGGDRLRITAGAETLECRYDGEGALRGVDWRQVHLSRTVARSGAAREEMHLSLVGSKGTLLDQTLRRDLGRTIEVAEGGLVSRFNRAPLGLVGGSVVLPDGNGALAPTSFEAEYDARGNRVRYRLGNASSNVAVDQGWRLASAGTEAVTHDKAGAVTGLGSRQFEHDAAGRLSSVTDASRGIRIEYDRDALGRAVERRSGGHVRRYFWDGFKLIGEAEDGVWVRSYVWDRAGNLIAVATASELLMVVHDGSGNIMALADGSGSIRQRIYYDAFGLTRPVDASARAARPASTLLFAGMLYDAEVEVYLTANRTYVPALGRFLEPDPFGPVMTSNPYVYARNDPLTFRDPLGLQEAGTSPGPGPGIVNKPFEPIKKGYEKAGGGVGGVGKKIDDMDKKGGKNKPSEPPPKKQDPALGRPLKDKDGAPPRRDTATKPQPVPTGSFKQAGSIFGEGAGAVGGLLPPPASPGEAGAVMGEGAGAVGAAFFELAPLPSSGPDLSTLIGDAGDGRWTYMSSDGSSAGTSPRATDWQAARPSLGPDLFKNLGLDGGDVNFGTDLSSPTAGQPLGGTPPAGWATPFAPANPANPAGDLLFAPGIGGERRGQAYDDRDRTRSLGLQLDHGPVM